MGLVHAQIKLNNPQQRALATISTQALVDTGAMVFGDEVLLGAIPMEDLDLLVAPARQELVPRDPRGPVSLAKGFAAS